MATSKSFYLVVLILLLVFFFSFLVSSTTPTDCPISLCGNVTIRFPFRLFNSPEQPTRCGHLPGFDLICNHPQNFTILTLPHSGGYFLVNHINYLTQTIHVFDPGNCLPKRLLSISFSGSPFSANQPSNRSLFSCPKNFTGPELTDIVECLGNETRSVLAVRSHKPHVGDLILKGCERMDTLMLPSGNSTGLLMGHDALEFRWDEPRCTYCETNGGMCGIVGQNNEGQEQKIGCFFAATAGDSNEASSGIQVFKIIAMSIAIPALTCASCTGVFLCILDRRAAHNNAAQQAAVAPQIPTTMVSTIDSYTKVVLGESKRVPGFNDGTCPICLSDFSAKETLRCIPECHHCFHADCIDEWIWINGSCPLCRKSLSPSPSHGS